MNSLLFLATTDLAGMARQTGETFGFDLIHFTSQLLSFMLVAVLLKRFAYDPLLKILEARRLRIAQGLEEADRVRAEVARMEARREEIIQEARHEAKRLVDEARHIASCLAEQEHARAVASASRVLDQAREAAREEHDRLLGEMQREVGLLIVTAAERVIGRSLAAGDQERMILETGKALTL